MDVKKAQGVVAAVAQNRPGRYGFRMGEVWYGGLGICPVEKGARVEVLYTENGRFKDVEEVRRLIIDLGRQAGARARVAQDE